MRNQINPTQQQQQHYKAHLLPFMADNGSVTLRSAPVLSDSKSSYLKALSLSTILGGYTFSAEESNVSISIPFHILQVCLYLVFPLIPFIIGLSTSPITAGIVSAIINCVLSAIIHFFGASSHAKLQREPLLSGDTLKQFTHIIKAKSILNILFSIAVLSALSFFSANFIAKSSTALAILVLITCLTTFFTLVGGCPQEFASVISTNADFSPSSSLHMRSVYLLTLFIVNISLDSAANNTTITVILPLLPLFFALGLLGPPYITTIYAIEKFNAYILGSSQGMASDLRLIISISSSLLAIIIIALISYTKVINRSIDIHLTNAYLLHADRIFRIHPSDIYPNKYSSVPSKRELHALSRWSNCCE